MSTIFDNYKQYGIDVYYQNFSDKYSNPHYQDIISCLQLINFNSSHNFLDLFCGDGIITSYLLTKNCKNILGCDKYMDNIYKEKCGKKCFNFSFEDIALNYNIFNQKFDTIIISYAFDLVPNYFKSMIIIHLSMICENLILLRPNKHLIKKNNLFKLHKIFSVGKTSLTWYKNTCSNIKNN